MRRIEVSPSGSARTPNGFIFRRVAVASIILFLWCSTALAGPRESRQELADAKREVYVARNALEAAVGEATKFDTVMRQRRAKFRAELRKAASDALRAAKSTYDAAARPVFAKTRASQEYADAVTRKEKAQRTAISQRRLRAARDQELQDAIAAVQAIEAKALAGDPKVAEAQAALGEAQREADALDAKVETALKRDEAWSDAKKEFDAASEKVASCRAALAAAVSREKAARESQWQNVRRPSDGK